MAHCEPLADPGRVDERRWQVFHGCSSGQVSSQERQGTGSVGSRNTAYNRCESPTDIVKAAMEEPKL
jgi:hypothetical protein